MSTKTNDPKQTAPEAEPVVDDIKTEPVTPDAEEKADKKTAQKEGKEKEPKASKEPKESKEKKETKKEIEADLAAEKDKYLRLLAEQNFIRLNRRLLTDRIKEMYGKELSDKYLRLLAEYDNFRRRSARERENIYADVRCETLKKFLPVYDSLSRALAQTPADDPARKGLEGIMNQYNTALNQLGVTAIEAVGQPFDANRHNAVMHIEDDAYGEGVVVEEFEKGFCIGDRVLRYSVVKVAN